MTKYCQGKDKVLSELSQCFSVSPFLKPPLCPKYAKTAQKVFILECIVTNFAKNAQILQL